MIRIHNAPRAYDLRPCISPRHLYLSFCAFCCRWFVCLFVGCAVGWWLWWCGTCACEHDELRRTLMLVDNRAQDLDWYRATRPTWYGASSTRTHERCSACSEHHKRGRPLLVVDRLIAAIIEYASKASKHSANRTCAWTWTRSLWDMYSQCELSWVIDWHTHLNLSI